MTTKNRQSTARGFIEVAYLIALVAAHVLMAGAVAVVEVNNKIEVGWDYPQSIY